MERPRRPILIVADKTHLDAFLSSQLGQTKNETLPDGSSVLKQIGPDSLDYFFNFSSTNMIEVVIVQVEHLIAVLSYLEMLNSTKLIITLGTYDPEVIRAHRKTLKAQNIRIKNLAELETWKLNRPKL